MFYTSSDPNVPSSSAKDLDNIAIVKFFREYQCSHLNAASLLGSLSNILVLNARVKSIFPLLLDLAVCLRIMVTRIGNSYRVLLHLALNQSA